MSGRSGNSRNSRVSVSRTRIVAGFVRRRNDVVVTVGETWLSSSRAESWKIWLWPPAVAQGLHSPHVRLQYGPQAFTQRMVVSLPCGTYLVVAFRCAMLSLGCVHLHVCFGKATTYHPGTRPDLQVRKYASIEVTLPFPEGSLNNSQRSDNQGHDLFASCHGEKQPYDQHGPSPACL